MIEIRDSRVVHATATAVWRAIQKPQVHARWHPFVTRIDGEHELGAVRRCSIRIGKKEGSTEEYLSDLQPEGRIIWKIQKDSTGFSRMVSDWSAGFILTHRSAAETVVTAVSTFQPRGLVIRLMLPMIRRKFHQTQRAILDGLDAYMSESTPL